MAAVPNFLFVFLMALGLLIGESGLGLFSTGYLITTLVQSMYSGLLKMLFGWLSLTESLLAAVIAYAVTPLFAPLAAWAGYANGVHRPIVNSKNA